jgi:hypothetical protein
MRGSTGRMSIIMCLLPHEVNCSQIWPIAGVSFVQSLAFMKILRVCTCMHDVLIGNSNVERYVNISGVLCKYSNAAKH